MAESEPSFKKNLIDKTLMWIEKDIIEEASKGKTGKFIFLRGSSFDDFKPDWVEEMLKILADKGFRLERKEPDLIIYWDK